MTSREALELCEILTDLNYDGQQTLLKPELFSKPNFHLVHSILIWLARIVSVGGGGGGLGKQLALKTSSMNETDIIVSLTDLGKLFYAELGVRLNLISLYRADYTSCPELLKVVRLVREAAQVLVNNPSLTGGGGGGKNRRTNPKDEEEIRLLKLNEKMKETLELLIDRKDEIRDLYSNLGARTQEIEQFLSSEESRSRERVDIIERKFDQSEIGQILKNTHNDIILESERLAKSSENLARDLLRLDEKLDVKEQEIQAATGKLNELLLKSPNYMEEYDRLHKAYELAYEENVAKYRNFVHLESCVYSIRAAAATDADGGGSSLSYESPLNRPLSSMASGQIIRPPLVDHRAKPFGSTEASFAAVAIEAGATLRTMPDARLGRTAGGAAAAAAAWDEAWAELERDGDAGAGDGADEDDSDELERELDRLTGGAGGDGRPPPPPLTTGPARLLESLFETGSSKPTKGSPELAVVETNTGAGGG